MQVIFFLSTFIHQVFSIVLKSLSIVKDENCFFVYKVFYYIEFNAFIIVSYCNEALVKCDNGSV